jgi:hypothetical protein
MLKRLLLSLFLLLVLAWLIFAYREARHIQVNSIAVSLTRLPHEFDGFRIVLASDLHLNNDSVFTNQIRERLGELSADVLMLAGDFKDLFANEKMAAGQLLQLMPAIQRFERVYAIAGNMDTLRMMREVETLGIRVLRNEREVLKRGDATLGIAGVSYPYSQAGLTRILQHFQDARGRSLPDCQILLSHSPDVMLWAESRQADLVLAGHTHGGQIRVPFIGPIITKTRLGRQYASGLFTFGNTQLFVTRGVGTTYVPLRFLAPPEIVLITLHTKE